MLRPLLALLLTLAALPALAQEVLAVGFTQDSRMLVVRTASHNAEDSDYLLYNASSGMQTYTADSDEETGALTSAELKVWSKHNPLMPLKTGPRSPDGQTQLEAGKGGHWKDGRFVVPARCSGSGEESPRAAATRTKIPFQAKTGQKSWVSAELSFEQGKTESSVEPIWSPDGRRVAYLIHLTQGCDAPTSGHEVVFGPTQGPRVQVLHVKERPFNDTVVATARLEAAGFAPTAAGEAKGTHEGTVVFAAKGFEAEAKKLAAALSGARVEKLTWKAGSELVVVLGE